MKISKVHMWNSNPFWWVGDNITSNSSKYLLIPSPALVPDHQRAKNNKYYFEKIIAEEQASTGQQRGDTGEALLRNPRHIDEYRNSEEFYTYERLCRGEETQVNRTFFFFLYFYFLVGHLVQKWSPFEY